MWVSSRTTSSECDAFTLNTVLTKPILDLGHDGTLYWDFLMHNLCKQSAVCVIEHLIWFNNSQFSQTCSWFWFVRASRAGSHVCGWRVDYLRFKLSFSNVRFKIQNQVSSSTQTGSLGLCVCFLHIKSSTLFRVTSKTPEETLSTDENPWNALLDRFLRLRDIKPI